MSRWPTPRTPTARTGRCWPRRHSSTSSGCMCTCAGTPGSDRRHPAARPTEPPGRRGTGKYIHRMELGNGPAPAVHHVPDRVGLPVVEAEVLRHNKGNAATHGIWRVRGSVGTAVLKIYEPPAAGYAGYWPTSDDPTHWNYWRREPTAHAEGLPAPVS